MVRSAEDAGAGLAVCRAELNRLRAGLISERRSERIVRSRDAGGLLEVVPAAVALPASSREVSAVLSAAHRHGVPVTVRGGGLTTEGETLSEGLVLDVQGLSRVLHVDQASRTAVVQGGADLWSILEAGRAHDLMLRAAPMNLTATLGGTVAVGGIDVSSFRAGFTADHVRAAEVVLPTGEIVRTSREDEPAMLDAVLFGYGQYGIATELTLELDPYSAISPDVFFYGDPVALVRDLIEVARDRVPDYVSAVSVRGEVSVLALGFHRAEDRERFRRGPARSLAADRPATLLFKQLASRLRRPWSFDDLGLYLKLGRIDAAIRAADHTKDGRLENRQIAIGRANWRHAVEKRLVLPDIVATAEHAERMVRLGIEAGRETFDWFTVYLLPILAADRSRHFFCPAPPTTGPLILGMEVTGYRRDQPLDPEELVSFKHRIYGIAETLGGRAYRCGGEMRSWAPKLFGEALMRRAWEKKQELDPNGILNRNTVFGPTGP